jgi:DNA polymerase III gamma/tau subunit
MTLALHDVHRPKNFRDVVGQKDAVSALRTVLKSKTSHAFLFSSNCAGVGKTTLARISAHEAGCLSSDILEVSAAVLTGVDDMRRVQELMLYKSFQGDGRRAVILDECSRISKQGWDSLLKIIEEAPEHAYFFFCTTDVGKVPGTIKSRCTHIQLAPLSDNEILTLLAKVGKAEKLTMDEDVLEVLVRSAQGSARQALVNLATCQGITNPKVAAKLVHGILDSDPTIELCRFLLKGGSWAKAMGIFEKLKDEPPESVRIVVCNYLATTLKAARDEQQVLFLLRVLESFEHPFNPSEGHAPLLLAIGGVLYGKG